MRTTAITKATVLGRGTSRSKKPVVARNSSRTDMSSLSHSSHCTTMKTAWFRVGSTAYTETSTQRCSQELGWSISRTSSVITVHSSSTAKTRSGKPMSRVRTVPFLHLVLITRIFHTEWNWSGSGEPVLSNILLLWTVEPLHADTSLCDARTGFYTLEIADYIMRRSSRHTHAAIRCLEHVLPMKYAGLVSRHKNSPEWRLTALATMYCTSSKTKLKSWPARPCQKALRS